jgi:adenosylcobinamide-phosphate guanylyltransferase
MAGGAGSRLGLSVEKPSMVFAGRPMVDRVLDALLGARGISEVYVALSPNTKRTEAHLRKNYNARVGIVMTPGIGYVEDMDIALEKLGLRRVFVASSDLPLLTSSDVDYVMEKYEAKGGRGSMAVVVPLFHVRRLGFTPNHPWGEVAASGVNVVDLDDPREFTLVTRRTSFAANINLPSDVVAALRLHKI